MTRGENGETVSMPHDVHGRAPIHCFLGLVLVNLMWAFQLSGTKIDDQSLGPIAVALIPLGVIKVIAVPANGFRIGRKLSC
jgi:hypothetical protein